MAIEHLEHLVKPVEPTVLGSRSHFELTPLDLLIAHSVETIHVIPGELKISLFNDALAQTLRVYPLAAGRLERPITSESGPWKIRLTNSGVPVTFLESDAEEVMPNARVVQNKGVASFVKALDMKKVLATQSDEPLARFTITRFPRASSTIIGFSQYHPIGDGYTVANTLRLLSQLYQGLPSLDPSPCYDTPPLKPINPLTSIKYPLETMPTFMNDKPFPYGGTPHLMGRNKGNVSQIVLHLGASLIAELQKAVNSRAKSNGQTAVLSKQDVLLALLARVFSISDPENPIIYLISIFNYRGTSIIPPTAACNSIISSISDPLQHDSFNGGFESIESIALRSRQALQRIRDADYFDAYRVKSTELMAYAAAKLLGQDFTPWDGQMTVNSTWKLDWTSPHFGYPGQTQFYHTILPEPRFIKIFQPNPTCLSDGTWKTYAGDAEITLSVLKDKRIAFEEAILGELKEFGIEEKPEIIHSVLS
ncbi:hypothetical protein QCA50_014739 [Cerrena zonata]|uniref:Uncharacterized protein n=1 Tax=Cerrena zonata TaxID=2478898 RepID=A0AAW0FXW9_9APHY